MHRYRAAASRRAQRAATGVRRAVAALLTRPQGLRARGAPGRPAHASSNLADRGQRLRERVVLDGRVRHVVEAREVDVVVDDALVVVQVEATLVAVRAL